MRKVFGVTLFYGTSQYHSHWSAIRGKSLSLVSHQSKKFSLFGHRVGELFSLKCKSFPLVRPYLLFRQKMGKKSFCLKKKVPYIYIGLQKQQVKKSQNYRRFS
jgi:hypothetical protein